VIDTEFAPAKLNLALHVRRRRDDGYHDLDTLFAFASVGDRLSGRSADGLTLTASGPFGDALPLDDDNLVLRAARALDVATGGRERGAALHLEKNLPVASGIGGGSADAAAALRLLDRLWGTRLPIERLAEIARPLGADIPACVLGGVLRGSGKGDDLITVSGGSLRDMPVLLVNPGVALATGPVFRAWDRVDRGPLPDGDIWAVAAGGRNDLEAPAISVVPEIAMVLHALGSAPGVRIARMSGSGATCFALFDSPESRDAAAAILQMQHPAWWIAGGQIL
jgi:4-diphosphocytidyl-2-C-methyl-D-erythritol kinase